MDEDKRFGDELTEELAGFVNTVSRPMEIEREFEKFLPEIRTYRKRRLTDKGAD